MNLIDVSGLTSPIYLGKSTQLCEIKYHERQNNVRQLSLGIFFIFQNMG